MGGAEWLLSANQNAACRAILQHHRAEVSDAIHARYLCFTRNSHRSRALSEDQYPWERLGFSFLVTYLAAGDHYPVTTVSSRGPYL